MRLPLKFHAVAQQKHQDDGDRVEDKPPWPGKKDIGEPTVHNLSQKMGGEAPRGIDRGEPQKMDQPPTPGQKLPPFSHTFSYQNAMITKGP
jgi:hypothetical protein